MQQFWEHHQVMWVVLVTKPELEGSQNRPKSEYPIPLCNDNIETQQKSSCIASVPSVKPTCMVSVLLAHLRTESGWQRSRDSGEGQVAWQCSGDLASLIMNESGNLVLIKWDYNEWLHELHATLLPTTTASFTSPWDCGKMTTLSWSILFDDNDTGVAGSLLTIVSPYRRKPSQLHAPVPMSTSTLSGSCLCELWFSAILYSGVEMYLHQLLFHFLSTESSGIVLYCIVLSCFRCTRTTEITLI